MYTLVDMNLHHSFLLMLIIILVSHGLVTSTAERISIQLDCLFV